MPRGIDKPMPLGIMAPMTPSDAIATLTTAGMTQEEIGLRVGLDQSTVSRIAQGKSDPRWALGQHLIALAGKHGKRPRRNRKR